MRIVITSIIITAAIFFAGCTKTDSKITYPAIAGILPFDKSSSGVWQIGYSTGDILSIDQFELCTWADTSTIIALWHPTNAQAGYYPYTGQNRDTVSQLDKSGQWALKPHEIAMEGSSTGQYSMLRFVAPDSGSYTIDAVFEGVHFNLSSTDVHILLNSQNLFDAIIEGYGGDSTFHAITGASPTASYKNSLTLKKGDIVTFCVGYGNNKTHYNDTTGLLLSIEKTA